MKTYTTSGRNLFVFSVLSVLFLPSFAFASVKISEVNFDVVGTDSGREWVEITNVGSEATSIAGWRLREAGTNHLLTIESGTSTLAAGEVAIISNNTQSFLSDYPNYKGALFKSSFSLSNAGEEVALTDKSLKVVNSATYSANVESDSGNSYHVLTSVYSAPNPGSLAPTSVLVKPKAPAKAKATKSSKKSVIPTGGVIDDQAAAVEVADFAASPHGLPQAPSWMLYGLGLGALLLVGTAAAYYVKPLPPSPLLDPNGTNGARDEFEIE